MHGNVWELCQDHWHESYEESPVDGSAWIDLDTSENAERAVRSGSWMDAPQYCRSAARFKIDIRKLNIGFRMVFSTGILL
jgi:formylglycine-generating enzyme required for sulfatase activity